MACKNVQTTGGQSVCHVLLWQPSECADLIVMILFCYVRKINMMIMMMMFVVHVCRLTAESRDDAEPPAKSQPPQQQQSEPVPSTSSSCATLNVDDSAASCEQVCIICVICEAYQN